MILESIGRHRDTFAWVLIGFVAVNVLVEIVGLFMARGFVANAAGGHLDFVSPVLAAALALAVYLTGSVAEPTPHARLVVSTSLGLAGTALLLGVVAWLGGLTVDSFLQGTGEKVLNSLLFLASSTVLGAVGWFAWLVFERLPAPTRPHQQWSPAGWEQYGRAQPGHQYGPQDQSQWEPSYQSQWGQQYQSQWGRPDQPAQYDPPPWGRQHPQQYRHQDPQPGWHRDVTEPIQQPAQDPAPEPAPAPDPEPTSEPTPEPTLGLSIFDVPDPEPRETTHGDAESANGQWPRSSS